MAEIKIYAKPLNLFRYRPLGTKTTREIDALENGYIYCPAFSDMNDPMEGSYRLSAMFLENPKAETRKARVKAAFEKMGIASFSEVYDHEPMWAHYADHFKGMCIQYNLSRLLKGLDEDTAITRMMYSEKEPVLLSDSSSAIERARLSLSCKTVRWASEREWRIFIENKGRSEYGDVATVRRIFLGSRVTPEDQDKVVQAARRLRIPVSKMTVEAYSMGFKLIPRPRPKKTR